MSVRKRTWTTRSGEQRTAWIVDYSHKAADGNTKTRHIKSFQMRREAQAYAESIGVDLRNGVHTPPSKSLTLKQAAADWIKSAELHGREKATVAQYRQLAKHVTDRIGGVKLADLTAPRVHSLVDDLLGTMSRPMTRKVLTAVKAILGEAQRRGNVAQNVALGVKLKLAKRHERKLEAGVDIPTPDEVKTLIAAADGRAKPLLMLAALTGLRASELRGLRWDDVDLKNGELHVRQRADRYRAIGAPKSASAQRTIPLGSMLANVLREWKLARPPNAPNLVFPSASGGIEHHKTLARELAGAMVAAGLTDADGKPKYPGLHALRHFYASWCINRRIDGGLELPVKAVQARLGHSSINLTADRYGHLFPRNDPGGELAAAEKALFG